jgi:uncharacterized protein with FMN-binding domain
MLSMTGGSNKKVANGLVALSSAAVLAVYAAGYNRTRAAALKFENQTAERRPAPVAPAPAVTVDEPPAAPVVEERGPISRSKAIVASRVPRVDEAAPVNPPAIAVQDAATGVAPNVAPKVEPAPEAVAEKAPAPLPAPPPAPPPAPAPATVWKDGTYTGWGTSRHGDIQASVIIESGRIASATIAQCLTRYSCDVIAKLPPQVAQRQSPEVDYVSGATQSTNAFYYAVVEALNKAK